MRLMFAVLLTSLLSLPAFARPLEPVESEQMRSALDSYLKAVIRGDAEAIVAALPPRVLNVFAGLTGIETKKLQSTLVEQTAALTKNTEVRDMTANVGTLEASDSTLADGTETTWLLIPTSFISVSDDTQTRNNQPLLALRENETWYFLRVDGPERRQLASLAYPFLATAQFPVVSTAPTQ